MAVHHRKPVCCISAQSSAGSRAGIPVELCLTSNVITESVTSLADHHFLDLYTAGARLLITSRLNMLAKVSSLTSHQCIPQATQ